MSVVETLGIDHVTLTVNDLERSVPFYEKILSALGFRRIPGESFVSWENDYMNIDMVAAASEESGRGFVSERRFAVDVTKPFGPLMLRAEGSGGTDDGRAVGGGIVLADYALTPDLELNTRYATWSKDGDRHSLGLGLTYQMRLGLYLRLADNQEFSREENNALTLQIYYEFSRLL